MLVPINKHDLEHLFEAILKENNGQKTIPALPFKELSNTLEKYGLSIIIVFTREV